mmetsp:Transcript_111187/g.346541  ORF Transcript_111187/g.346541 Transcript_111187/m.346541 type:complete len:366 (-) Transcript_111187:111-1208(-)
MPLYPLYREVQLKYGDELEKEHRTKHAQVAALEFQARETTSAAALASARRRTEGRSAVRGVEQEAAQRVQELESERLDLLKKHHPQLLEVQQRIEGARAAADQRIREIEEETHALYAKCEADILSINAERDAATRAARERCAQAERMGDGVARAVEQYEREVLAEVKKAQAEEEEKSVYRVMATERRCEAWRKQCEDAVAETQRRVAECLEDLLAEAQGARVSLEENRERIDRRLAYDLERKREVTADELEQAKRALAAARQRLRDAKASAEATGQAASAEREARDRQQLEELHAVASRVEAYMQSMSRLEALDKPIYIQRLEDLATRLRSGKFYVEPAPDFVAPSPKAASPPGTAPGRRDAGKR